MSNIKSDASPMSSINKNLSEDVNMDLLGSFRSAFKKTASAISGKTNESISGLNKTLEKSISKTTDKLKSTTDKMKSDMTGLTKKAMLDTDKVEVDLKENSKLNKPTGSKGIFSFFDSNQNSNKSPGSNMKSENENTALDLDIESEVKEINDIPETNINTEDMDVDVESNISDKKFSMPEMPEMPEITMPLVSTSFTFMTGLKLLGIIIIIAFLGLNIFTFLSYGTDFITQTIKDGLPSIIQGLMNTIQNAAMGASKATQKIGDTVLSSVENKKPTSSNITKKKTKNITKQEDETYDENKDIMPKQAKNDNVDLSLVEKETKTDIENNGSPIVELDNYSRNIQQAKKSGFCYIGSDRGYRTCTKINEGDVCMSGNIFPTMDQCVNPRIR